LRSHLQGEGDPLLDPVEKYEEHLNGISPKVFIRKSRLILTNPAMLRFRRGVCAEESGERGKKNKVIFRTGPGLFLHASVLVTWGGAGRLISDCPTLSPEEEIKETKDNMVYLSLRTINSQRCEELSLEVFRRGRNYSPKRDHTYYDLSLKKGPGSPG